MTGSAKESSTTSNTFYTYPNLRPGLSYDFNVLSIDRYETESNPQSRNQLTLTDCISMQYELQRSLRVKRSGGSASVTWDVNLNPRCSLKKWIVQWGSKQEELYTIRIGFLIKNKLFLL